MHCVPVVEDIVLYSIKHPLAIVACSVCFFTVWSLVLVLFHQYVYTNLNMILLTAVVAIYGLHTTYIRQAYIPITIADRKFKLCGGELKFFDALAHQLPFVAMFVMYAKYYSETRAILPIINVLLLFIIYMFLVNVPKQYELSSAPP